MTSNKELIFLIDSLEEMLGLNYKKLIQPFIIQQLELEELNLVKSLLIYTELNHHQ